MCSLTVSHPTCYIVSINLFLPGLIASTDLAEEQTLRRQVRWEKEVNFHPTWLKQ